MERRGYVQLMVVLAVIATAQPQGQQIRYALFISGRDGEIDVSGVVPAAELAEERIRADSSVLREYEFQHSPVVDTLVRKVSHYSVIINFSTASYCCGHIPALLACMWWQ